jgi:hypothetical protein
VSKPPKHRGLLLRANDLVFDAKAGGPRPEMLTREQALEQAKAYARAERDKDA